MSELLGIEIGVHVCLSLKEKARRHYTNKLKIFVRYSWKRGGYVIRFIFTLFYEYFPVIKNKQCFIGQCVLQK